MLTSGRTVPDGEVIHTDVCVVGAGIAGLTVAGELVRAGHDVVVIERGGLPSEPASEPHTVDNVGLRYALDDTRAFGVGGSINKWKVETPLGGGMGRLRELDESDFERRSWIPHSGWPISKADLAPWYAKARACFDVPTVDDATRDEDLRPLADGLRPRAFVFANPAGFPGKHFRALETHNEALILVHAAASHLITEDHVVSGLQVVTEGPHFVVRARRYVLAAGAIETARILLMSRRPNGTAVGNAHDLVGRFFMEHPHYSSGVLEPANPALVPDDSRHRIHLRGDALIQPTYSLDEATFARHGLPRSTFILERTVDSANLRRLGYRERTDRALHRAAAIRRARRMGMRELGQLLSDSPHLARHAGTIAATRIGRAVGARRFSTPGLLKMYAMSEQIPNPSSRVTLVGRLDDLGLPMGALDWQLTDADVLASQRTQALAGEALSANGVGRVRSLLNRHSHLLPGLVGGAHHMGTARMADEPSRGVVDRNACLHEAPNVSVAGAAVFPTVGYANPSLTIVAQALRLSAHLNSRLLQPE